MSDQEPTQREVMIHLDNIKGQIGEVKELLRSIPQMANDIHATKQAVSEHSSQIVRLFEKSDAADAAIDAVRGEVAKALSFSRGAAWALGGAMVFISVLVGVVWSGVSRKAEATDTQITQFRDSLNKLEGRVTIHDFQIGTVPRAPETVK